MNVGLVAMGTHQGARTACPIAAAWPSFVASDDVETIKALAGTNVTVVADLDELASRCELVVFREIADDDDVERFIVRLGAAMPPGGIVVNTRPWGQPSVLRQWAEVGEKVGVAVLDSMSSGPRPETAPDTDPAWASMMVGGDRGAYERARPVIASAAGTVAYMGGPGTGELAKLVNTLVFNANLMVVAELFELGDRLEFDLAGLIAMIQASTGVSYALDTLMSGGLDQWGSRERNIEMFRTRLESISSEIRDRGLSPSRLEDWARSGIDALPATGDRAADLTQRSKRN